MFRRTFNWGSTLLSSTVSSKAFIIKLVHINEEEHVTNCIYVKHSKIHNDHACRHSFRLVLSRIYGYILHDNLKLYANNSVLTFKQFCALYFTIDR